MNAVDKTALEQVVRRLADPIVARLGLEIVDTALGRRGRRVHVRLDIDRPGPDGVRIDDCAEVSAALQAVLDESDTVGADYLLEVSSPGIDRPIRTDDDVRRNTGRTVVVETREPVGGHRSFHGILVGGSPDAICVRGRDNEEVRIPRAVIVGARQEVGFK